MKNNFLSFLFAVSLICISAKASHADLHQEAINGYTEIVRLTYKKTSEDAKDLQKTIKEFLDNPSEDTLNAAKNAWIKSRDSYGQSEVFRFYEGPIDFADGKGNEGPEARLNSWPLDESYIDYVTGDIKSGIVFDNNIEINKKTLSGKNQELDEAQVATGYHAIEFLLWGQDLSKTGPGNRPYTDYISDNTVNNRRREYLQIVTDLLVDDLDFLVQSWDKKEDNYASKFLKDDIALSKILTALATLSGFELASERMATALDSGDQEDEHSCFSDNTHNDFIANQKGVENVFLGKFGETKTTGIYDIIYAKNPVLANNIKGQIEKTKKLIQDIPHPIDNAILSTPKDSNSRKYLERVISELQTQADMFRQAGKDMGVEVQVKN